MTKSLLYGLSNNHFKTVLTIATQFVNFKHNFPKEIETFFKNKLKWIKEKSLKMHPFPSELSFHIHNWLIINLKDFCIVIRKWPTFLPSTSLVLKYKKSFGNKLQEMNLRYL